MIALNSFLFTFLITDSDYQFQITDYRRFIWTLMPVIMSTCPTRACWVDRGNRSKVSFPRTHNVTRHRIEPTTLRLRVWRLNHSATLLLVTRRKYLCDCLKFASLKANRFYLQGVLCVGSSAKGILQKNVAASRSLFGPVLIVRVPFW